ncbi:MAG: serine/threonine protein kinase [Gammaproteobacteria bacterium]|nr:serine/threonine protein kinase [Gammaproteobacteria bacterium]
MEIPGFEIKRRIGQGGMATAYLAEQRSLGREVVLKVLDTATRDTPETIERFLNEGRIIASLNHPHIITIYDIGRYEDKVYISMEYVEGGDLKQRMQRTVFMPAMAIDIIEKVAGGLAAAHDSGIVHRDVKPGNILFRRDGTPLLSDFGIAKRLSGDSDLTSTGMFLGSPNYMAPEQSEAGPIDGRADIYSLGVILYEMLAGERAYSADSVIDVIVMHKKAPVPKLPAGHEALQELLELMMAKNRRDRFRDARSLIHYIRELRRKGIVRSDSELSARPDFDITGEHEEEGETTRSTRVSLIEKPRPRWPQWLLLGGLVTCALGWGALLVVERKMQRAERPAIQVSAALESVGGDTPATGAAPAPAGAASELVQVKNALLWLGQHSLDEMRLTAPPRDNAYYYFTRLLQLDPGNAGARAGLKSIAAQCALLAEREIAQNRFAEALSLVGVGLQIDPDNESLRVLHDLADKPQGGFLQALRHLFDST